MTAAMIWLDAGGCVVEQGAQVGTEQGDGNNDDDGDQSDHQPVLDRSRAAIVVDPGLEFDEAREHFGPLPGTGF